MRRLVNAFCVVSAILLVGGAAQEAAQDQVGIYGHKIFSKPYTK